MSNLLKKMSTNSIQIVTFLAMIWAPALFALETTETINLSCDCQCNIINDKNIKEIKFLYKVTSSDCKSLCSQSFPSNTIESSSYLCK